MPANVVPNKGATNHFWLIVQLFVVHLVSSTMSAMVQNATQSLSEFHSYVFQLMHYFYTFIFCLMRQAWLRQPFTLLPFRDIVQVSLFRFLASVAIVHLLPGTLEAYRYAVRPADFVMTALIMRVAPKFVGKTTTTKQEKMYIAVIAVTASLSYFYQLDSKLYSWSFFCYLSLGIVCGSLYFILCQQKFQKLKTDFNTYAMNVTGWNTALLLVYSIFVKATEHREQNWLEEMSFEVIDYMLFVTGFVFMTGMIYTEMYMNCQCAIEDFLVLRHFKYTLAAVGCIVVENFYYVSRFNCACKLVAVCFCLWYLKTRKEAERGRGDDTKKITTYPA